MGKRRVFILERREGYSDKNERGIARVINIRLNIPALQWMTAVIYTIVGSVV